MPSANPRRAARDPAAIAAALQSFLSSCLKPVLIEPGEAPVALEPDRYSIEPHPPGCVLQVWGEGGGLARRIVEAGRAENGVLPLRARRLGGAEVALELTDAERRARRVRRIAESGPFGKFLHRALARQFPGESVEGLTAAPDLRLSLSSNYHRGAMRRGDRRWAVAAAPFDAPAEVCDDLVLHGLIWLHELRLRSRRAAVAGLRLIAPHGRAETARRRAAWLDPAAVVCEIFEAGRDGELRPAAAPGGNLRVELPPARPAIEPAGWAAELAGELAALPGAHTRWRPDGALSVEAGGLSFARIAGGRVFYGIESDTPAGPADRGRIAALAREVLTFRAADAADRNHALYRERPELWLAAEAERRPEALSPLLRSAPLYRGVPETHGRDSGVLDLLGRGGDGRLVVVELKSEEDIRLPFQALDYWIAARAALRDGLWASAGYFRGVALADADPRIVLAAPALKFHPRIPVLTAFLSPAIEIELVGLNSDWRSGLRAEFRQAGRSATPGGESNVRFSTTSRGKSRAKANAIW